MAPHSSTLAWKTPWTEEPGGLQSMGATVNIFNINVLILVNYWFISGCPKVTLSRL